MMNSHSPTTAQSGSATARTSPTPAAPPFTVRTATGSAPLLGAPWGVPRADGRVFAKDPSVIPFGDRYLMYFTLPPSDPSATQGWHVGIAASDDLCSWELVGSLGPTAGGPEEKGLAAPGAVVLHGKVHLFYQSYGQGRLDAICHAVSEDGIRFERDASNPVFRPIGPWNCGRAIDADVIVDGDRLLMSYATRDREMKTQILGVASAPLDSDFRAGAWTDLSVEAPALAPELPWEQDCIEAPALGRVDGELVMFYAGAYNNQPQQIGWATSTDGVHWQRGSATPVIPRGEPGEWNSCESGHPGLLTDRDGSMYLFLQGNDEDGRSNLLAGLPVRWEGGAPVFGRESAR